MMSTYKWISYSHRTLQIYMVVSVFWISWSSGSLLSNCIILAILMWAHFIISMTFAISYTPWVWSYFIIFNASSYATFIALLYDFALMMLSLEVRYLHCEARHLPNNGLPCEVCFPTHFFLSLNLLLSFVYSRKSF